MSLMVEKARKKLIVELATKYGITITAADDIVDHIQELVYELFDGVSRYNSVEEILTDFGISSDYVWVFNS